MDKKKPKNKKTALAYQISERLITSSPTLSRLGSQVGWNGPTVSQKCQSNLFPMLRVPHVAQATQLWHMCRGTR